uniref:Uncharacterized protein n=1 Tax=Pinctada fucata TaxID=50426 RepID=A0A194AND6_PINFU
MGFSESPLLSKVALFVLPVGCLFVIIGTATNSWYSYSLGISQSTTSGLWKGCVDSTCVSFNGEIPDYLKATRAFAILSILIAVGGTAIIVVAILKNESKPLQILAIVLPAVSAVCAFIAVGVYGVEYESQIPDSAKDIIKLSWSFALTAVGGCIEAAAAVVFAIGFFVSS